MSITCARCSQSRTSCGFWNTLLGHDGCDSITAKSTPQIIKATTPLLHIAEIFLLRVERLQVHTKSAGLQSRSCLTNESSVRKHVTMRTWSKLYANQWAPLGRHFSIRKGASHKRHFARSLHNYYMGLSRTVWREWISRIVHEITNTWLGMTYVTSRVQSGQDLQMDVQPDLTYIL